MKKLFDDTMPEDTLAYDDGSNNRAFNAGTIGVTNNAASIYINARNQNIKVMVDGEETNLSDVMDHFRLSGRPGGRCHLCRVHGPGHLWLLQEHRGRQGA